MTRSQTIRRPFGAGILEEGRAVQRRADDVPNPQRRVPDGQPPAGPAGEAYPEAPAPREPTKVEFRVQCEVEGYPVTVVGRCEPSKIRNAVRKLAGYGLRRPPRPVEFAPDGAPICPKHRAAMREREKQGDTWFSHKVTDERGEVHFCRGRAGKDSPGWLVPAAEEGGLP